MNTTHNGKLTANAKTLRKHMTKEERHLWYDFLKTLPIMVHRQKVIGNYIVDFYIAEAKIVIELDGSQHFDVEGQQVDALRDEIKQEMVSRNTEELTVGQYIVRWTSVLTQRFDSTAFKKVMPDIYKAYTKQVASRRFTIA